MILKKDKASESKSKWSVVLVTGKGKTYGTPYVKVFLVFLFLGFVFSILTSFALGIVTFSLMKSNNNFKLQHSKIVKRIGFLEKENQDLKQKLAFFSSFKQDQNVNLKSHVGSGTQKSLVIKSNKKSVKKKDHVTKPGVVSNKSVKVNKNLDQSSLHECKVIKPKVTVISELDLKNDEKKVILRKFNIKRGKKSVLFSFDILNKSDVKPLSGYIFVLLKSHNMKPEKWVISPYSKIDKSLPLNPENGQFFSISRFKPVEIKFPFTNIFMYKNAEVLVFSSDGKLILKKGFLINDRKNI